MVGLHGVPTALSHPRQRGRCEWRCALGGETTVKNRTTFFGELPSQGWPDIALVKPYFEASGKSWFGHTGNDSASFTLEGIAGDPDAPRGKGRLDLDLYIWGDPRHGVLLWYHRDGRAAYRRPGAAQDPPVLLVQNKPSHPYAVQSLYDHEGYKGGHTIERHVGKSDTYLLKRLTTPKGYRLSFFGQPRPVYHWEESTFRNIYEAQAFINATLSDLNNNSNILDVINEIIPPEHGMAIEKTFARIVGHGYVNKAPKYRLTYRPMQPKRVVMYAARVVIYRDPDLPAGFRVHPAYPIEEQKR